jgi:alkanesulfonate monooxygenase SsuD/methylene tetrahydromethanopterin reductase-like flavin-dependent oxidoreductase (luciferase family)
MKIGVVIMLVESKSLGRAPRYAEIRDMAMQAEAANFDSIWLYDHLLYRSEDGPTVGIWECWTVLSALAEATRRVELGILAKMATTLDEVSAGRFILGIGAGWNKPEYDAFGIPFDHRVNRFEEALQIIHPLLKTGHVNFEGSYYRARDCEITPRGPRPTGPPLMIGSFGPRMMRLAARYADLWNTGYLHQPDSLAEPRAQLEAACVAEGRDPASIEVTGLVALGYPDLADLSDFMEHLSGSTEEVVQILHAYEQLGVSHLMFHVAPYNSVTLARLAEAVALYRQL